MQNTKIKIFDSLLANYAYARPLRFLVKLPQKNGWQSKFINPVGNLTNCLPCQGWTADWWYSCQDIQAAAGNFATSSYAGPGKRRGTFSRHLTMTTTQLSDRILLVDDLVDSGITLQQTIPWLKQHYSCQIEIRTAVLWYKACSELPRLLCGLFARRPWIHQPFEHYEHVAIDQLAATCSCFNFCQIAILAVWRAVRQIRLLRR